MSTTRELVKGTNGYFQVVSSITDIKDKRYKEFRKKWDYYSRTLEASELPLHVDIEITNACNLRCEMCERNKMTRKIGYMDYNLFRRIIDECARCGIYSVKLNLWGESVLHKELFKMIRYAKKNNIYTQFNTNATFVTDSIARRLICSDLDRVTFSVDSTAKDAYEDTRRGARLASTMKNVDNFIRVKPVGKKPLLTLQCIKMKKNLRHIPQFIEHFKDKADFVAITNITSTSGDPKILKEAMIDYKALSKIPCKELWRRLAIFWNGDVTVCCEDYDGFLKIGNIQEKPLKELWQSERLTNLREAHKRLDFAGLICGSCTANYRLSGDF